MNDNLEITKAKNGGFNVDVKLHKDDIENLSAEQGISPLVRLKICTFIDATKKEFRKLEFQKQKKNKKHEIWNNDGNSLVLWN